MFGNAFDLDVLSCAAGLSRLSIGERTRRSDGSEAAGMGRSLTAGRVQPSAPAGRHLRAWRLGAELWCMGRLRGRRSRR